jgi:uncharacterized membrane protein
MAPDLFSSTDALRFGWNTTRANLKPLLILAGIAAFLALLSSGLERSPLLSLAVQVLQMAVWLAFARVALLLHDGKPLDLTRSNELLRGFWGYLLASVLVGLIVAGGLLLLVVPGVIWGLTYGFAGFLVADRDLDPVAALRESRRLTVGRRWQLLEFALLAALTNLVGALAFGVGLLVTVPTTFIATAHVLRRLQAHADQPIGLREAHA